MDVRVGLWRKLSAKALMLLNCGVGEDSWESLGLQGDGLQVHPKGDQSWLFIGRTHAEAETPICWPPDAKNWVICKDPDAGKGWRQEEKGTTEGEMVGWHHWLNGGVWANSGSWWWTGKPGVLQSIGLQSVGHDWATELNWLKITSESPNAYEPCGSFPQSWGKKRQIRPYQRRWRHPMATVSMQFSSFVQSALKGFLT